MWAASMDACTVLAQVRYSGAVGGAWGDGAPALFCIVKKSKRYLHNYVDGELVRDVEMNETFVFRDKSDGFAAQHFPARFRVATAEEKTAFAEYAEPHRP